MSVGAYLSRRSRCSGTRLLAPPPALDPGSLFLGACCWRSRSGPGRTGRGPPPFASEATTWRSSPWARRNHPVSSKTSALSRRLGSQRIPPYTSLSWVFAVVVITVFTVVCLVHSTYGGVPRGPRRRNRRRIDRLNPTITRSPLRHQRFFAGVAGGCTGTSSSRSLFGFDSPRASKSSSW